METDFYPSAKKRIIFPWIGYVLIFIVWLILFIVNLVVSDADGPDAIIQLQGYDPDSTKNFFRIMFMFIPFTYQLYYLQPHSELDPLMGIKILIVANILVYSRSILAMIYAKPLPYLEYESVEGWQCLLDWSMPSERTMVTFSVSLYYILLLKSLKRNEYPTWVYLALAGFFAAWNCLVSITEIIIGIQTVIGMFLSIFWGLVILIPFIIFDSKFTELIINVLDKPKQGLAIFHIVFAASAFFGLILFETRNAELSDTWEDIIDTICHDTMSLTSRNISAYDLHQSTILAIPTGALLGFVICYRTFQCKWWGTLTIYHKIIRVICSWVYFNVGNIFIVIFQSTSSTNSSLKKVTDTFGLTEVIKNPYFLFFFDLFVFYQMGWMLTYLYPIVISGLNLSKPVEVNIPNLDSEISFEVSDPTKRERADIDNN
ncbi:unnamed protein product [Blepharisma stoltei]|uniref:Uncharacterized protein n=1 Tax=Blepharisma stoltei TaxID=1481888 RepID=A0AAU9IUS1_9CILI|nr:unnamed protein product [Blepharisma stoltei]